MGSLSDEAHQTGRRGLAAACLYAAVAVLVGFALRYGGSNAGLTVLVLNLVMFFGLVPALSRWIARRLIEPDIYLPILAWWMGSGLGVVLVRTLVLPFSPSALAGALVQSLSLWLLVPHAEGFVVPLFTLGGMTFSEGVPWVLMLIYAGVFARGWRRASVVG